MGERMILKEGKRLIVVKNYYFTPDSIIFIQEDGKLYEIPADDNRVEKIFPEHVNLIQLINSDNIFDLQTNQYI